jgi:hypothetical protein
MSFLSTGAMRLKNSVVDGLRLTRLQRGLLFGAVALLALFPLVYLSRAPVPFERNLTDGTLKLYFSTNNMRATFPNQCVDVTWNVEGIKTVSINGQGRVGTGTEKICDTSRSLTMLVELQDGSTQELRIGFEKLFLNPIIGLLFIIGLVALTLSLYNLFGTWVAVAALIFALTVPTLLFHVISEGLKVGLNDYSSHIHIAEGIMDGSRSVPPHFLYHAAAIGWVDLFPGSTLKDATLVLMLAANILTGIGIYAIFRLMIGKRPDINWKWTLIYLAIPLLLFIGPIDFKTPILISARIYPNPIHSPTFIFLKPFVVGLFACFIALCRGVSKRWLLVAGMAALTILGSLAKPAYTLPLVPVIGLLLAASFVRPIPIKRWELIAGILLPAVLVLGWQYLFTYGPQQSNLYGTQASIKFMPLELYLGQWQIPAINLVTDFIISLLFPLFIYVVYRQARRDIALNIAWLIFIVGQALGYLFIEVPKLDNGNMVWSGRITSLVLFVVAVAFFLRQNRDLLDKGFPRDGRFYLGMLLLAIHIIPTLNLLL